MDFDFRQSLRLENSLVALRPLQASDAEDLLPVATAHSDLVMYSPYRINTTEGLQAFVQASLADRETGLRYPFAIIHQPTGTLAGSTSIANVSNKDRRLEIGWTWLGRPFQQTGLNRACKYLLLHYGFETLGFERVEFKTDERNLASRTAIEKIGGRYEGALRSHTVMPDGFRRTTVYYSILKAEWPGLQETVFRAWATERKDA